MNQNRSLFLVSVLAIMILTAIPATVSAQVVLLDTFDGGTVGLAPAVPDIGFFSSLLPNRAHLLVDPDANGDLRVRCLDDVANDGCRLSYTPIDTSVAAVTSFLFRIESGVVASGGANDFDQQLIMSPPGTNLSLEWSAFNVAQVGFGQLGVRIFANGEESQFFVNTFQWFPDTDYFVEIAVDASTDLYSLTINGNVELKNIAFGADFTSLDRITLRSGFATTGATQIDDVQILQVPEAGAFASAIAALATVGLIARRRGVRHVAPMSEGRMLL